MKLQRTCAALAAALTLCLSVGARAEDEPLDRRTPRGAMHDYLAAARAGDFERAAKHLDLGRVPAARRPTQGPELARHLKIVLDQTLWVDLDALSGSPEGNPDDGLPAGRDRVGKIHTERGDVPIMLQRVSGPDGEPVWKVAASTVALVPELYEEFGYGPLGKILPSAFFETQILDVQLWQWIALLILAVLAYALAWLVVTLGLALTRPVVARSDTTLDDELLHAVAGPARLVIFVVTFAMAGRALSLAVPVQRVLSSAVKATAAIAVTWLLMRLVDVIAELATRRLEARGATAQQFMPLGRKALKGFLVVIAMLAAMDSFGFNVTALLAGLGVGGLAVALAAQKTLENLFGGVTLLADRPVQVGDFCRFGDKVGVVEDIGLRSTRVRTLDRTLITVPNAEFSTLQLENFAVMPKTATIIIHTTAPGPPLTMATATPAMFPSPTVALRALVRARK